MSCEYETARSYIFSLLIIRRQRPSANTTILSLDNIDLTREGNKATHFTSINSLYDVFQLQIIIHLEKYIRTQMELCKGWLPFLIVFFSKCTRMAIMPILASEALFRENKKIQLQKDTLVSIEPLDL